MWVLGNLLGPEGLVQISPALPALGTKVAGFSPGGTGLALTTRNSIRPEACIRIGSSLPGLRFLMTNSQR
jgi:hypothetical protein